MTFRAGELDGVRVGDMVVATEHGPSFCYLRKGQRARIDFIGDDGDGIQIKIEGARLKNIWSMQYIVIIRQADLKESPQIQETVLRDGVQQ